MRPTLGEGQTPLLPNLRIAPLLGLRSLSFKLENTSPSGSYKDRFIAAQIVTGATLLADGGFLAY